MGKGRSYLFRVESPNPEEVSPFLGGSSSLFDRFIGDGRSYFPFGQPCAEPAFHFSTDIPEGGISPQVPSFPKSNRILLAATDTVPVALV